MSKRAATASTSDGDAQREQSREQSGEQPVEGLDIVDHVLLLTEDLEQLVQRRRDVATAAVVPGHGAFIGEADVDAALVRLRQLRESPDAPGHPRERAGRVEMLGELFDLSAFELLAIVAAAGPDVHPDVATLYAYLNDHVDAPSLSYGLLLELAGVPPWQAEPRLHLSTDGRLARAGLITTVDTGIVHRRQLTVPDRVLRHLLGLDQFSDRLERCVAPVVPLENAAAASLGTLFDADQWFVYVRDRSDASAPSIISGALLRSSLDALHVDLRRLAPNERNADLVLDACREAALQYAALVIGPLDAISPEHRPAIDLLGTATVPVIAYGRAGWNSDWCRRTPALVEAPPLDWSARQLVWQRAFEAAGVELDPAAASMYHLSPAGIYRSVQVARVHALSLGTPFDAAALAVGVRSENGVALEHLARRITPRAHFADLVLDDRTLRTVHELVAWVEHRDQVLDEYGMRGKGTRGRGIAGLFAGGSGTGKTLAAEVVAGELGLDLYVIDLSTVVSKYIGETEENLEKIFREATGVNGILFFDEADALFGKRSGVSDSKDRYANLEVAYLLQRMEQFDGVSLMASNLRANLDEAFTRRLDFVITFPDPGPPERLRLWDAHLPESLARADDVDLAELAERFTLSGGEIANCARAAGYFAARSDGVVTMRDLVRSVAREYDKVGRLLRPADFGPWLDQLER